MEPPAAGLPGETGFSFPAMSAFAPWAPMGTRFSHHGKLISHSVALPEERLLKEATKASAGDRTSPYLK